MSDQYFGTVKKTIAKSGTEYYKGHLGKVPVVGFVGNEGNINFKINVGLIKWIDEQEDETRKSEDTQQQTEDNEPLPF